MKMIGIVTDSTCDIPEKLITKYGIVVVSHVIIWGDEEYRDRIELTPKEFYEWIQADPLLPTTAQASTGNFLDGVKQAVKNGADEVLILTVSSAMSGAYNMAVKASEQAEVPVRVVDSKSPTMSLGWQVLAAARARDEGADMDAIIDLLDKVRQNLVQIVAMDTLKYLQTGGRIGDAAKWVGGLLKVKPVVSINHESGRVQPVGLARTHQKAVDMLYKKFFEGIQETNHLRVAVLHGDSPEEAQKLADRIRQEYHPVELIVNITGPVLGINTGPGALALCGYAEP
jgi:DegV family protein with EDD domain